MMALLYIQTYVFFYLYKEKRPRSYKQTVILKARVIIVKLF